MKLNHQIKKHHNLCLALLIILGFSNGLRTYAQNKVLAADTDWAILEKSLNMFESEEAYEVYVKLSSLELKRYEDKHYQQKMRLAESFWNNYPQDDRRDDALKLFLSADPYFIPTKITDSVLQVLTNIPRKEWLRFMRAVPVDMPAMKQWRKKGVEMTNSILLSNASLERKEEAEFLLFARDIRNASRNHGILPKDGAETNYWELIDMQYWEQFRLRFDIHISKYADLEKLGDRAKDFLYLLKSRSPAMAEDFWRHFLQITDSHNPLSDKAGIKALHNAATEQLETLEVESGTKTLDMKFTAIDGTIIDLTKMRGKVILIDFWASWCSPCIAEIPHLKAMYDKYRNQGFEVIGIAMDEESAKKRVQEILKKNKALWPQRFEGKGFNGDSYGLLYGINSLPTVWLIDKEGKIVDSNARGEKLEPLIRKYLGLD